MKIVIETTSASVEKEIKKLVRKNGAKSFRIPDADWEDFALSQIARKGLKGKNVSMTTVIKALKAK